MFPVCTGIYRRLFYHYLKMVNVPCMHRDIPHVYDYEKWRQRCSLYAQGYTEWLKEMGIDARMFPVCTGIYRNMLIC